MSDTLPAHLRSLWSRPEARWLTLIVAVGLVLRLAAAVYLGDQVEVIPVAWDQVFYHDLALNLLAGKGFVFTQPPWPFIPPQTPTAFYSFLYPRLLAAVYWVADPHALVARVVQAILCSVLPLQMYGLVKRIMEGGEGSVVARSASDEATPGPAAGDSFASAEAPSPAVTRGSAVALVAAAITAGYAYFVFYSATLMTEGLYLVLVAWALSLTLDLAEEPSARRWAVWGLAVGLTSLLRQVFMPMAALLFLYVVWKARRRVKIGHVALAGAIAAALILPWTVRNYLVFDRFLLLNSQAGQTLWNANHPDMGTEFWSVAMYPIPAEMEGLNEAELDSALMQLALQNIAADPGRFVGLSLSRLAEYFRFWPIPESSTFNNVARTASFTICLPFMVVGLVLSLRDWRRWLLLYLFIATYTLIHVISWAGIRYRLPVDVALVPFAALAVVGLTGWLRAKVPAFGAFTRQLRSVPARLRCALHSRWTWAVIGVSALGLGLRLRGIGFGLPYLYHYDEIFYVATALKLGTGVLHNTPYTSTAFPNMLFPQYAGYYVVGHLLGIFASTEAFEAAYRADPSTIYLLGRGTSAVLSAATVPALYWLGKRAQGKGTGLVAAALLAVSFLHVRDAHYAVPDAGMPFFVVLAVALATAGLQAKQRATIGLAGLVGGLALAMKWTALPVIVPIVWASVAAGARSSQSKRGGWLVGSLLVPILCFALGFAVGSPQVLLNPSPYLREAFTQTTQTGRGGSFDGWVVDTVPSWLFYGKTLVWGVGAVLLALGLWGGLRRLWLTCRNRDGVSLLLLLFPVTYLVMICSTRHYFARYALPLVPFLALFAAEAVTMVAAWIAARRRILGWVTGSALGVAALALPLVCSLRSDCLLVREDTRTQAKHWTEGNLPEGAKIALDWENYGPALSSVGDPMPASTRTYDLTIVRGTGLAEHSIEWYVEQDYDYLISSSFISQIPVANPDRHSTRLAFYDALSAELTSVHDFEPSDSGTEVPFIFDEVYGPAISLWQRDRPGPTIRIYRVGKP